MSRDDELQRLLAQERIALKEKDHAKADGLRARALDLLDENMADGVSLDEAVRRVNTKARERMGLGAMPSGGSALLRVVAPGELAPTSAPLPMAEHSCDTDIPASALPAPAREICLEIQRIRGGPLALSASMACGVLATLAQGKVRYRITPLWTEEACLYWLVFTPPSAGKSTTTRPILAPLRAFEADQERVVEQGRHYVMARRRGLEARMAQLGKQAAQGDEKKADPVLTEDGELPWATRAPDAGGPSSAKVEMKKLARELERYPVPIVPRLTRTDINPQMLPKRLAQNQRALGTPYASLGILSSEPAFLSNLKGRHSGGIPILETVLSAYDGEAIQEDRAGDNGVILEANVARPLLSIVCQGQPDVLEELLAVSALGARGFWSRCIVHNLQDTTPWTVSDAMPDPAVEARWCATVKKLAQWTPDKPVELDLSPLRPEVERLYKLAEQRCKEHPEQTARARRGMVKVLRLIGLAVLCDLMAEGELSRLSGCHNVLEGGSLCAYIPKVEELYNIMYLHVSTGEEGTGPRTDPHHSTPTSDGARVLATMRQSRQLFGEGKSWATRDLQRYMHKVDSWLTPALEELEERGYIEHDPKSIRRYAGRMSPKRYTTRTLDEPGPTQEKQP